MERIAVAGVVLGDDDRRRYVNGLASVLKPVARLFLLCFSDEEPGEKGPRRVSEKEIRDEFAVGREVESIDPSWEERLKNEKTQVVLPGVC